MHQNINTTTIKPSDPHHIVDNKSIHEFLLAGNAIFTLRNTKSGNRITFKVKKANSDQNHITNNAFFVSTMTGSDNERSYDFIGTLFKDIHLLKFKYSLKSKIPVQTMQVATFEWFIKNLHSNTIPQFVEFWHEGRCGRCGRLLTVPESIASGIGPVCGHM